MTAAPLVKLRAGRMLRRDEPSRIVEAQGQRGLIYLVEEEGLMHFCWKEGDSNAVIEDLIIFPNDASFLPVPQSPRTYVLKFSSSDARHFFWCQDPSAAEDESIVRQINDLLQAPEEEPAAHGAHEDVQMDVPAGHANTTDQFAAMIAQFAAQHGDSSTATQVPYTLPDVLAASNILELIKNKAVRERLYAYLPDGVEHTHDNLRKAVQSIELKRSLANLDTALRTGALQPLVQSLGLDSDAALGVDNFLQAVQRKADSESRDDMQSD